MSYGGGVDILLPAALALLQAGASPLTHTKNDRLRNRTNGGYRDKIAFSAVDSQGSQDRPGMADQGSSEYALVVFVPWSGRTQLEGTVGLDLTLSVGTGDAGRQNGTAHPGAIKETTEHRS